MRRGGATLAGLFLVALTLRPQVVGIGPLFPSIEDDTGASHTVVGLLATIPILCMGLFAPAGAYLAHRIGTRSAITFAVGLIGIFGVVRGIVPGIWLVILLTWPVGIGMGLGNALAAIAVKERLADMAGTATGVYAGGMQIGSTTFAAIAVPLAVALGDWRWTVVAISLFACAMCVSWVVLTRREPAHRRPEASRPRLPWRSRSAWLVVAVFALTACGYYGLSAWLPDAYTERGWSERDAGALIALMNLTAIPVSFVVPWLSDRTGQRQPFFVAASVLFAGGAIGLVAMPSAALGWVLVTGVGQGVTFALVMTLPLDLEDRPERAAGLVAMMLGVGYLIAAATPIALGALRDATGSFEAPLWVTSAMLIAVVGCVLRLGPVRARAAAAAASA